jgi:glycosyltransferase involved in cell wall biosynthesis
VTGAITCVRSVWDALTFSDVRIALVSTPFIAVPPPAYGGTELVVHALACALGRAGHEVVLYATGDSRGPDVRAFFKTPVWPPDPYLELLHCHFAARDAAEGEFDVVHVHTPAALAYAEEMNAPVVYTHHHVQDARLSRYYAHAPSAIVRVAISARQAALEQPAPDHVVHHGLEPDLYGAVAPGDDAGYAFFLGRLAWCKGPELAIAAARQAGIPLVVAGTVHADDGPEGWEDAVLRPALRQPHVRWIAEADLDAKRRHFAGARALLVPIRWEEPFGLVMIEAMLAGCPVIAYRRGAAPELVEDGVTGWLVDDVDEMAAALRRARRFDRVACRARALERFSSDRMARDYLAVYRAAAVAAKGGGVAPTGVVGDGEWTTFAQ